MKSNVCNNVSTICFFLASLVCASASPTTRTPSIGRYVSMNDAGQVAFIGTITDGSGDTIQNIYTFNSATPGQLNVLMNSAFEVASNGIGTTAPSAEFSAPMIKNNGNVVAWRYLAALVEVGFPLGPSEGINLTYVEEWPFAGTPAPEVDLPVETVAMGSGGVAAAYSVLTPLNPLTAFELPSPYDEFSPWQIVFGPGNSLPAQDNNGLVAFCGIDTNGQYWLTTSEAEVPAQSFLLPSGHVAFPRVSDNGLVVATINDGTTRTLVLFSNANNLTTSSVLAGPGTGFTSVGLSPCINDAGTIVAFYGDYEGTNTLIGTGPGVFATLISTTNRTTVRVVSSPDNSFLDSNLGVNNSGQVVFKATDTNNNEETLFAARVTETPPFAVTASGSLAVVGSASTNGLITDLEFYAGLANTGYVAYWIQTSSGNVVVQRITGAASLPITPLRVGIAQADVKPSDDIDAPIVPVTDANVLATANTPLGMGVVADGVTPVLFKITDTPGDYTITINNNSANLNPSFYTNIYILQDGAWTNSTNLTITSVPQSKSGTAFAYLQGLDWSQFLGPPPYTPVMITISVMATSSAFTNSITFEVRPPPIVLIHGYNANSSSWTPSFLTNLFNFAPSNFVFPINYGTANHNSVNTTNPLNLLAPMLDQVLASQVEALLINWAYTRYDVVGHSQGGVLARMLCQNTPNGAAAFGSAPVVSDVNYYRGRFRRVITIGSPHNGSLLLYYILQLKRDFSLYYSKVIPYFLDNLPQPKFDPFGPQIAEINNPALQVDSRIKFVCIQTTIGSGQPPSAPYVSTPEYGLLGLSIENVNVDIVKTIFPNGTDGVVDFASQGAGFGTMDRYISTPNITHANVDPFIFGVPDGQSQTTYALVAQNVMALLNGSADAFGAFKLPGQLPASEKALVDSLVSSWSVIGQNLIAAVTLSDPPTSTNYYYQLEPPVGVPAGGVLTWYAQVFSTNGISEDGIDLQTNPTNAFAITVSVTNNTEGTVVLYATYASTNGILVVADPVVVVSNPPNTVLSGIELQPTSEILSIGDTLVLDVWAQYTNGVNCVLYLTNGQAIYQSSDSGIASVDGLGNITMNAAGTATITATFGGFTGQCVVSTPTVTISEISIDLQAGGAVNVSFMGSLFSTNIVQVSSDLVDWHPAAVFYNTNGFIQYLDSTDSNVPQRFYRIAIP
jgi:pimeloyl-ACP methyl ester carboxylesterase